jgi:glycosyltransferase involved in cell wall biosynthesis
MKIVHIQQYYNDGMGYQENILPRYHSKLEHDVVLITSTLSNGFTGGQRQKREGKYQDNGFKVHRIPVKGEFKNRFVIFENLYDYLKKEKPDYIYHHSVIAPSLAIVAKYKKEYPEVFLAVDNHADLNISAKFKLWKLFYYNICGKFFAKKYDKYVDVYFGVTPSRCLFMNEELGINNHKIRLLPIGADVEGVDVSLSRDEFLEKYKIDKNSLLIVHGGKITPEKETDKILRAFMRIKSPQIRLILFGDIKDENVKELIPKDKRIMCLPWLNREETMAVLKFSDIGIWNTQHTTLLEDAVAVNLPMILRYYGSTCHLIKNTGLFLYEGSVREIQDKLNFIIENEDILKNFRENTKQLKNLLSYGNIAKESIEYMKGLKPNRIHHAFMNEEYTDLEYPYLRKFKRGRF